MRPDIDESENVHTCDRNYKFEDKVGLAAYPEDVEIYFADGMWMMGVEEYYTPISYCPFCAKKLVE